jgi:hypothetical protein
MRVGSALSLMLLAASPPAWSENAGGEPSPMANVVIYRDYAEPLIWGATVTVDGRKLVTLGEDQYSAFYLEPGEHRIKLSWSFLSGQRGKEGTITIEDGETLYLEIKGTSQFVGMGTLLGSGLVLREDAREAIASCCKFKPPKS